jgi:hypothetical protein
MRYNEEKCWRNCGWRSCGCRKCGGRNHAARSHRGRIRGERNQAKRCTGNTETNIALWLLDECKYSHSVDYRTRLTVEQLVVEYIGMRNRYSVAHESPEGEHLYHDKASGRICTVKCEGHGEKETITAMDEDGDILMSDR